MKPLGGREWAKGRLARRGYLDGATPEDIASELGLSQKRVRRVSATAEKKLREDFFVLPVWPIAGLACCAQVCFVCVMSATAILRTRIEPRRKARVEKILDQLGMTSTQAVNMFFAQIERRKAIPFPVAVEDNSDIAPPIKHIAKVWDDLDQTDFSHLDKR